MGPFVSKLLGMGDLSGLMEKVADLNLQDKEDMMKRIQAGKFAYITCLYQLPTSLLKFKDKQTHSDLFPPFYSILLFS